MFNYVPSPTGMLLHNCDKYLKMIVGPYGSGNLVPVLQMC